MYYYIGICVRYICVKRYFSFTLQHLVYYCKSGFFHWACIFVRGFKKLVNIICYIHFRAEYYLMATVINIAAAWAEIRDVPNIYLSRLVVESLEQVVFLHN